MEATEEDSAKIISIQDLMTAEIGAVEEKTTPPTLELDKKKSILGLNEDPKEEEEEEEDPKEDPKEEEPKEDPEEDPKEDPKEEEPKEEPKEDPEEDPKEDPKEEEPKEDLKNIESGHYLESIKSLFGDDITHIIEEDEDGNQIEVPIEEVEFTQEVYNDIAKAQLEKLQKEAKEGTISADGISEFTRELIEIDRMGGDVQTLLKSKETYIDTLDKLDLTDKEGQKSAVYMRLAAGGQTEEEIDILIQGYESKGVLTEKAEIAEKELRDAVQAQVDQAKKSAQDEKEKTDKILKEYKKEVRGKMDQFELDDRIKTKAVNIGTKRDDKGRFEIDSYYRQMKQDPEKAARLFLFLIDSEEYDKQVGKSTKKKMQLDSAGKLTVIKKSTSGGSSDKKGSSGKKDNAILISDLNKE